MSSENEDSARLEKRTESVEEGVPEVSVEVGEQGADPDQVERIVLDRDPSRVVLRIYRHRIERFGTEVHAATIDVTGGDLRLGEGHLEVAKDPAMAARQV
jgi:hypothetical protein